MSKLPRGLLNAYGLPPLTSRMIPARAGFTCPPPCRPSRASDHPRSRGVYTGFGRVGEQPSGSSPLARGLRDGDGDSVRLQGIIPARAGFTTGARPARWLAADHPRSRGVYRMSAPSPSLTPGSSPLARGLRQNPGPRALAQRIIPARAGFTPWAAFLARLTTGSSPLARGLRVPVHDELCRVGIIPARAGFTAPLRPSYRTSPDHPRSRGVYAIFSFRAHKNEGSSPLARGLRLPRPTRGGRYGIIPARAGFTPLSNCVLNELEGSSPLARGLRDGGREHAAARRIIPARAGFTSPPNRQVHRRTDHPRSRGVYSPSSWRMPRRVGSSPLARGLHIVRVANLTVIRIIPARAGFTFRTLR